MDDGLDFAAQRRIRRAIYAEVVARLKHERGQDFVVLGSGELVQSLMRDLVAWHPPQRVVMAWRPHSMPEPPTDVEVTFTARAGGTLVELEHRGWERLSDGFRAELYEVYARGWVTTLGCFAAAADQAVTWD